jgi:hypothetical protein
MKKMQSKLAFGLLIVAAAGSGAVAYAQDSSLSIIESIERGMWQFRLLGGSAATSPVGQLCVGDVSRLAQLQHGITDCDHYVVRTTSNSVTVSYSCKGQGQGLTTIRKESGKLIQIQSQGIRNNAPFSFSVEARKTGSC